MGSTVAALLSRRWRWMTLAALFTCLVTIKLGFWQLDRLAGRRAVNVELASRLTAPPLSLSPGASAVPAVPAVPADAVPGDARLQSLEFRQVQVRGTFDYGHEVALANQIDDERLGLHLLTPLVLEGSDRAVMVDRGWIPAASADASTWDAYHEPGGAGPLLISGWVHLYTQGSRTDPLSGGLLNAPNLSRVVPSTAIGELAPRAGHPLVPVIVNEAPDPAFANDSQHLPVRRVPVASIGEGVHMIAAIQWFLIGGIVLIGQVAFVYRHEHPLPPRRDRRLVVPPVPPVPTRLSGTRP